MGLGSIVTKPDHISNLERRLQSIEDELTKALLHYSTDDLLVADLRRRLLHLRDEIFLHHHEDVEDKRRPKIHH